jgi:hypothetical protein
MTHVQLRDAIFVADDILGARRRAQAHQLRQERSKLVLHMQTYAERVNKIDRLLFLLE